MNIVTRDYVATKEISSEKWRELRKNALKSDKVKFVIAYYSDYGGEFQDRVFIETCEKLGLQEHIVNIDYFGKYAVAPVSLEEADEIENSLDFEFRGIDMDEVTEEIERRFIKEEVKEIKEDHSEWNEEVIADYLCEFANLLPNGLDYNGDQLEEYVKRNMKKQKEI